MKSLLICGGVGGAKLAKGFYRSDQNFDLLVNVGDDFNHFGLHISPDLDTVCIPCQIKSIKNKDGV